MELKSSLRRAQSLKNISPGHARSWTEAGLWDRKKSVSQLVAQYQTSLDPETTSQASVFRQTKVETLAGCSRDRYKHSSQDTLFDRLWVCGARFDDADFCKGTQDPKKRFLKKTAVPRPGPAALPSTRAEDTTEKDLPQLENISSARDETPTALEPLLKKNEMRKHQWEQSPHGESVKLSHSRSMENLPRHRPGSISALRALFESKAVLKQKTGNANASNKIIVTPTVNGNVEIEMSAENSKTQSLPTTVDKVEEDVSMVQSQRRRTISGISLEKSRVQYDEKRRSLVDQKDFNSIYGQEKPSASVKALSALYLSKLAAVESKGNSIKTDCGAHDHMLSSVKKNKASKAKMADHTHQKKVAEGFNGIDTGRYQSLPSQNSHQNNCSLRSTERHVFLPICPPKETFSEFYQRRKKSELKRLYRRTHPELKALNNVIDKDLEEALNSEHEHTTTSNRYEGEVQSMRWMFENWTMDNIHHRDLHATKEFLEENIASQGRDVKGTPTPHVFEHRKSGTDQFTVTAGQPIKDCIREDIHNASWMSEKQPLDALKRPGQDDAGMETGKWNELIQSGDLFRAEPCCVLHDSPGNMRKLKPMFNKELPNRIVRIQHCTPSADKSVAGVLIFQGIPLGEDQKDSISRDRKGWMTEGQALDDVCQVAKEDTYQGTIDTVEEYNVMAKQQLFDTQPLAELKEEPSHSEHIVSKEDIVGADVRSILWSFETKSVENDKDSNKLRGCKKVSVSGGESGLVMKTKHVHEPSAVDCIRQGKMEGESVQNACGTKNNDVKSYKHHFETIPQRNFSHLENENKALNIISCNENLNKALFETTPVKGYSGIFHEVTVGREKKTVNRNVPNCKWMFETKIQDQLEEGKINFEFNGGREIDCLNSASKEASHSRGSHSKRTCAFRLENKEIVETHETELDELVVDEQRSDLQAAMRSLRQATVEARSIEHMVQERQRASAQKCLNQPSQAVSLSTVDDVVQRSEQETDSDVVSGNVKAALDVQQGSTILQSVDKEEIVEGNFQAALRSLEKSNINISTGDFKAAMLYRNAGKSHSAQKKKQDLQTFCKQDNVESHSVPLMTDKLAAMKKAVVEDHITDKNTNAKPSSSTLSNQPKNPPPSHPRPVKQKPAIPPKPDHLKQIPGPVTRSVPVCTIRSKHLQQTQ